MRAVNYLEPRLNAQIVHRPNQDANVVAEYFAKNLVYLPISLLLRTESPNLPLTIENTDSTLERLW